MIAAQLDLDAILFLYRYILVIEPIKQLVCLVSHIVVI